MAKPQRTDRIDLRSAAQMWARRLRLTTASSLYASGGEAETERLIRGNKAGRHDCSACFLRKVD